MSSWRLLKQIRARVDSETHTLHRQTGLRVALCYPSPYPVGMSSLGFQTIYREIHLHPDASADRAFLPDDVPAYRREKLAILTYESERPLSEYPVVAFSIAFELEIPGILEMLHLSGVPLFREERSDRHPLVVMGGPLTNSNPIPLSPFADIIVLGEAEETIHTLLQTVRSAPREDWRQRLASRQGFYVPGVSPALPPIAKAPDSLLPARSQILTPESVLSSMFLIEAERGCSRGCTYCVMRRTTNGGMRTVPPGKILSLIPAEARKVGLVGAAVTDHPRIKEIVRRIVDSGREIGISSLRADRLDEELVQQLARGGYRTLTTASDGASQRIRDFVDRKTSEQDLIRAAQWVRRFGLRRLKLYQLVGVPGETEHDVDELIRFALELSKIAPLSLGIAPFVAKRNTPLDGTRFEGIAPIEAKLARLRRGLRGRVETRPTSARWAWVEYMLSQGDERAGLAAYDAWREGAGFAAWKKAFRDRQAIPVAGRKVEDGRRSPPPLPSEFRIMDAT